MIFSTATTMSTVSCRLALGLIVCLHASGKSRRAVCNYERQCVQSISALLDKGPNEIFMGEYPVDFLSQQEFHAITLIRLARHKMTVFRREFIFPI